MANPVEIDPEQSPRHRFAFEMRKHRLREGWTQKHLAKLLLVATSTVGNIETTYRAPDQRFAAELDRVFGLQGEFQQLYRNIRFETAPPHVRDYRAAEEKADELHIWSPMLIPGMFQTEAYARKIFEDAPGITPDEVDARVHRRMQRQTLVTRDRGPLVLGLIDEGALHRWYGGAALMREQFDRLLEIAVRPGVTIQIVPYASQSAAGLMGAFEIAIINGSAYAAYLDSTPDGRTAGDRSILARVLSRWNRLRAAALPERPSLELIKEMGNRWT
ncbi:helix-turn-helix transcriptional regulator [Thermopolyspora sp. NPDC052614]|uniref:helix-turn-helix domain-containing protein n=1 Tax=Thermopolyspora sp. NPDC052614 TaxID=3155682 RepID=UPI0034450F20